jgi:predicted RecA/RadA family phage recombinase
MAVVDTTAGFKFENRQSGAPPTIQTFKFKDTETIYKGDMVNMESGKIDLAVTGDTAIIGIALQTQAGEADTTKMQVIVDFDAVYSVYDPNARNIGTLLDLTGSAGAQGVTTSSNGNFVVVANSAADERTLVKLSVAAHPLV